MMPWPRRLLLALAAVSLLTGIAGGLQRVGVVFVVPALGAVPAIAHGALMVCGFLGTVISLERAIAWGRPVALVAPAAAGLGTLGLVASLALPGAGAGALGAFALALLLVAPLALAALSVGILRRQPALHNAALFAGALAWLAGDVAFAAAAPPDAVAAWWFTFIVLTVAAERLELGRLRPQRAAARPLFLACGALLVVGAAGLLASATLRLPFAAGLLAIAVWLAAFDIAWRTLRAGGYARYAACALLAGYAWLVVAAVAWALPAYGLRDVALHAIGLGFAFSMIFAHAPIIVPVVARVRVQFSPLFYVPLVALHASLLWRLGPGWHDLGARREGAWLNAAALLLFVVTLVAAIARSPRR